MDRELYASYLRLAYAASHALMGMPLAEMAEAISRADAAAPLLDPTAYLRGQQRMHEDEQVIAILRHAADELRKLPWPEPRTTTPLVAVPR